MSHRLIYALFVGPVPEDRQVMHLCSNRACVRPSHLRIGTHAENMRQKVREGNKSCGIPIPGPMKKLIRQRDLSVKDAARVFGVCPQTVRKIRREE